MTKQEKFKFVEELTDRFKAHPGFYLVDISGYASGKTSNLRRKCFEAKLKILVAKNKLIEKSLQAVEGHDYGDLYSALNYETTIIFFNEDAKAPAKLIKSLREGTDEKPVLKAAYVEGTTYLGDGQLDFLVQIKSKNDLLGELVGLLQSPAKNVISALKSPAQNLAGILQTLEERQS